MEILRFNNICNQMANFFSTLSERPKVIVALALAALTSIGYAFYRLYCGRVTPPPVIRVIPRPQPIPQEQVRRNELKQAIKLHIENKKWAEAEQAIQEAGRMGMHVEKKYFKVLLAQKRWNDIPPLLNQIQLHFPDEADLYPIYFCFSLYLNKEFETGLEFLRGHLNDQSSIQLHTLYGRYSYAIRRALRGCFEKFKGSSQSCRG